MNTTWTCGICGAGLPNCYCEQLHREQQALEDRRRHDGINGHKSDSELLSAVRDREGRGLSAEHARRELRRRGYGA
jgi:hypothetical protein